MYQFCPLLSEELYYFRLNLAYLKINGYQDLFCSTGSTMSTSLIFSRRFSTEIRKMSKVLTLETINPHVRKMEYAVRGPIVQRAGEIEKELKNGVEKPFKEVIRANIGDCHAVGQKPITYLRQVVGCCVYPPLLEDANLPSDVKDHAKYILEGCSGGSSGSYTHSAGIELIRKDVAAYISKRDGFACDYNHVFLSTGASDAIKIILKLLMTSDPSNPAGVMIPIPQYPLYSATNAEYGAYQINYYLDEDNKWGLDVNELQRALDANRDKCTPRAICVINPGNPTGQVLPRENIEAIIKFAKKEKLFILADEVYQHNIYAEGAKFHSFKKVLSELGKDYENVELASFMSVSKGYMGECGMRGGYCEVVNLDPDVRAQLMKSISAKLCPNTPGQAAIDVVVNHPQPGKPSYDLYMKERTQVLTDLNKKAKMTTKLLNEIEGVKCNEVMGAMYAFPNITIPEKAIKAAKEKGQAPDAFYCFQLLENTGICVVPGSGFGQREGTYHFRMTILPSIPQIEMLLQKFKTFHMNFLNKYN